MGPMPFLHPCGLFLGFPLLYPSLHLWQLVQLQLLDLQPEQSSGYDELKPPLRGNQKTPRVNGWNPQQLGALFGYFGGSHVFPFGGVIW